MKMVLILVVCFISLNAVAELQVKYKDLSNGAEYSFERNNENKAKERMAEIIDSSEWIKGEWTDKKKSAIISKKVKKKDGPGFDILYFHPENIEISITDITQEKADKAKAKADRKKETQELKGLINSIKSSDLPQWHKRILKRIVKDLKE